MSAPTLRQLSRSLLVAWFGKGGSYLRTRGAFLVEVLVAVSIMVTVAVFVSATISLFVTVRTGLAHEARRYYLAEEGYEMIRFLRDEDWNTIDTLTLGQHYGLSVSTTTVAVSNTPEVIDGQYTRTFVVNRLQRDNSGKGAIVSGNSGVDNEGRQLEVFVADERATTSLKAVLVNMFPS